MKLTINETHISRFISGENGYSALEIMKQEDEYCTTSYLLTDPKGKYIADLSDLNDVYICLTPVARLNAFYVKITEV